jgi:hypothetical protein
MNQRVGALRRKGSAGYVLLSVDLVIVALAGLLSACSSGGEDAAGDGASVQPGQPTPGQAPAVDVDAESAPAPFGRYQFVDTPEGMTVEALRADGVLTLSCPARSCAGLCDECAAAACRAAGDLEAACALLAASCSERCNCESGGPGCGFPVCAYDRQLCYIGDGEPLEAAVPGTSPGAPGPDPSPEAASRPAGSGASTPAPLP